MFVHPSPSGGLPDTIVANPTPPGPLNSMRRLLKPSSSLFLPIRRLWEPSRTLVLCIHGLAILSAALLEKTNSFVYTANPGSLSEHKTSVRTKSKIGLHFNEPGHSLHNMEIDVIEKVFDRGRPIIEKRESMWIEVLEAEYKGVNQKQ